MFFSNKYKDYKVKKYFLSAVFDCRIKTNVEPLQVFINDLTKQYNSSIDITNGTCETYGSIKFQEIQDMIIWQDFIKQNFEKIGYYYYGDFGRVVARIEFINNLHITNSINGNLKLGFRKTLALKRANEIDDLAFRWWICNKLTCFAEREIIFNTIKKLRIKST